MKTKILYVEDELFLGKIVKETLENDEFDVLWEVDGKKVLKHLDYYTPDICVLDVMLPNIDGYSLCKAIKNRFSGLPVIFLTAKSETEDLVKGFESGGSDYIKKPFSMEELRVRIRNQLNMKQAGRLRASLGESKVKIGKYMFSVDRYELQSPSLTVKLSQREMEVLNILVANINQVLDRKELLLAVWGDDSFFNSRNLDVYVRKLRDYFKEDESICIKTLKGKGYLFLAPSEH